jgi:hypothetical protein
VIATLSGVAATLVTGGFVIMMLTYLGSPWYPQDIAAAIVGLVLAGISAAIAFLGFKTRGWLLKPDVDERRKTIVVAAALALPVLLFLFCQKVSELMRSPSEGAVKGNLGAIRSAVSIYYGDMEGVYPSTLESLTVGGKYLPDIPPAKTPNYHQDSSAVTFGKIPNDAGGWLYNNDPKDKNFGAVLINCTHTDRKGTAWNLY